MTTPPAQQTQAIFTAGAAAIPAVTPDRDQAELFLKDVYGNPEAGILTIFSTPDRKTHAVDVAQPDWRSRAAQLAAALCWRSNAYFALGLQNEAPVAPSRGSESGVIVLPGFGVDVDVQGPNHKATNLPPDLASAHQVVREGIALKPTLIAHTGGGIQVYWLFKEPFVIESEDERQRLKRMSVAIQRQLATTAAKYGWAMDRTASLEHLFRLPGTFNLKQGAPVLVTYETVGSGLRYNLSDFEEVVTVESEEGAAPRGQASAGRPSGDKDLKPILSECGWMRHCAEDAATLIEAEWYRMLGVVACCVDGRRWAHELSRPYPRYSPAETDQKFDHAASASGPATCAYISSLPGNDLRCSECRHRGRVQSPATLGIVRRVENAAPADDDSTASAPEPEQGTDPGPGDSDAQKLGKTPKRGAGPSQSTQLLKIVRPRVQLFQTPDRKAYISHELNGHVETHAVKGRENRLWLQQENYSETGRALSTTALTEVVGVLEAEALFAGPVQRVFTRVGEHEGTIFYDLGDPDWRAVAITGEGWSIVPSTPIRFRRAPGMLPAPMPVRDDGAALATFRKLLNLDSENFDLLQAWTFATLRPQGPYPLLNLSAEHGAAKSTTTRMIVSVVDPKEAPLRSEPREPQDLMIAAGNNHILAFDNLSQIDAWLSDALCRLATGGGFSTRELYSDDGEVIFDSQKPVIVNGIDSLAVRADLLDRSLIIDLLPIPPERRRTEREIWAEFDPIKPGLLAHFLDATVAALANLSSTKLELLPRMADFAVWTTAGEAALGISAGGFLRAYTSNQEQATSLAIEASLVGRLLLALYKPWSGTATELLELLNGRATDSERHMRSWPTSPRGLSNAIHRLAPALRATGIDVDFDRAGHDRARRIRLRNADDCGRLRTVADEPENANCPQLGDF